MIGTSSRCHRLPGSTIASTLLAQGHERDELPSCVRGGEAGDAGVVVGGETLTTSPPTMSRPHRPRRTAKNWLVVNPATSGGPSRGRKLGPARRCRPRHTPDPDPDGRRPPPRSRGSSALEGLGANDAETGARVVLELAWRGWGQREHYAGARDQSAKKFDRVAAAMRPARHQAGSAPARRAAHRCSWGRQHARRGRVLPRSAGGPAWDRAP